VNAFPSILGIYMGNWQRYVRSRASIRQEFNKEFQITRHAGQVVEGIKNEMEDLTAHEKSHYEDMETCADGRRKVGGALCGKLVFEGIRAVVVASTQSPAAAGATIVAAESVAMGGSASLSLPAAIGVGANAAAAHSSVTVTTVAAPQVGGFLTSCMSSPWLLPGFLLAAGIYLSCREHNSEAQAKGTIGFSAL
jgi:hypothetical protein